MMFGESINEFNTDIKVSFGYQCNNNIDNFFDIPDKCGNLPGIKHKRASSSFSCLCGAALSANATLANTNICSGLIGEEILPTWDSPKSFRRIPSSPSMSKFEVLSSSLQSSLSNLSCSPSTPGEYGSLSAPFSRTESFLNATEVQVAGGAAGEDRVQAVCSEENGWLFCAIYDGFNGRDAADFLAGTLYEAIGFNLNLLDCEVEHDCIKGLDSLDFGNSSFLSSYENNDVNQPRKHSRIVEDSFADRTKESCLCMKTDLSSGSLKRNVLDSLERALSQTENDFLYMVEQEMDNRPDLVSIGSCVLVVLLIGTDLYTLGLGDSRAVVASYVENNGNKERKLKSLQLTDKHTVDNDVERTQLLQDHPDDPAVIVSGRVKGKLKITRAFGVGYLKKKILNNALMGILRVRNLLSPPYISVQPSLNVHSISCYDQFVILGSDGLFDFFSNDEVVNLVHSYILNNPSGDPAKYLLKKLVSRAANSAGFSP